MHCITLETKYDVPTASLQTESFVAAVEQTAYAEGLPNLRFVYVPQPVMGKSPSELRDYVNGLDPITGESVMAETLDALTLPVTEEPLRYRNLERSTPRFVEPDTEDNIRQLFMDNHWTDYLPIVLPTEARVEAMLEATSHAPDEVVGQLRPTSTREAWSYTVEKVAVNAVMAGADPAYFPVILALASTGVTARGSTTSSSAAMVLVNGPIRHEINMNWGIGAMGPYNHANATIGRAYGLFSQNLQGGSVPGHTYLGSQGNNYAFTNVCFAENEERSPWVPFHVQQGFDEETSVVSAFKGCRATAFTLGLREDHWEDHVRNLLRGMDPRGAPCLILDPITADLFVVRGGFDTKEKLIDWVYENALMPAGEYWDYQLIQNYILPVALQGIEPYATKLEADEDELIRMFRRDQIQVVVVGGETNGYWRIMSAGHRKSASVDAWR